jgi:hypothetical protein
MSELEQAGEIPRNDAGQFTPSSDGKFGLEGVEAEAGYVPLTPTSETDAIEGDSEGVRAAFDDFVEKGGDVGEPDYEPTPVYWQKADGSGEQIAPNITTTVEQAGAAMTAYEHNVGSYVEGAVLDNFVAEVDQARAEMLKSDPGSAQELGLDPAEVAKNAQKNDEPPASADAPLETNNNSKSVEGLDPEVAKALAHPQVRQAIEQELGKADAIQQAAHAERSQAYALNQAAITAVAPELGQIPLEQMADAIKVLAQVDPPKAEAVINLVQKGAAIEMQMLQEHQQRAAVQAHQFQAYKIQEEAKFNEAVGTLSQSDYEAVRSYATGVLGLTPQDVSALQNNPVAVDHRFQRALLDASRFYAMNNASKALPTRNLPPVQRPGTTSPSPRGSDNASQIAKLNAALDSATSETQQLKIAARIMELRSASR